MLCWSGGFAEKLDPRKYRHREGITPCASGGFLSVPFFAAESRFCGRCFKARDVTGILHPMQALDLPGDDSGGGRTRVF